MGSRIGKESGGDPRWGRPNGTDRITVYGLSPTRTHTGTTISVGGDCLTYMVESPELEEVKGKFYATPPGKPRALFGEQRISTEAQDAAKAQRVWELSEQLLKKVLA